MRYCSDNSSVRDGGQFISLPRWQVLLCAAALVVATWATPGRADESVTDVAQTEPPKLHPVFSDDFSTDTRSNYEIKGDVSWEAGKLSLARGASISRELRSGAWIKIQLRLASSKLTPEIPRSDLRIWLMLDRATDCYIRFRRELQDGNIMSSLAYVDTSEHNGKLTEQVVRQIVMVDTNPVNLDVEYRGGMVRLTVPTDQSLTGYIRNGAAMIDSVRIEAIHTAATFRSLDVSATNAWINELSDSQKQQLAKAESLSADMVNLYRKGKFTESLKLGESVLQIRKTLQGEQHPSYAIVLNDLAALYYSVADYARAEPLYRKSMEIRKLAFGEEHPDYAQSLNNLASLYESTADYVQAEALFKQSMEVRRLALGEKHPDYASSLNNLAGLYLNIGAYSKAESLYRQASEIWKSVHGDQHRSYALSLNNLANVYKKKGDYSGAEELCKQSMKIFQSQLGEQHPSYAISISNLAEIYKSKGEYTEAARLHQDSMTILRSVLGEKHPYYATSVSRLASIYRDAADYGRAEPLYKQAMEIRKATLGEGHPSFATSLNSLASLYEDMGDFARAEPLFKQSIQTTLSVHGDKHPDYGSCLHNLAVLYFKMKDYARAEALYKESLNVGAAAIGKQNPSFARSLNALAVLYISTGDYVRAEPLLKQSTDIIKTVLGRESTTYATNLNNLASLYYRMGHYARAEPLYRQAIEIEKSALGEKHVNYAQDLNNLASLYVSMGDSVSAAPLFEQALRIHRLTLDSNAIVQSEWQQKRNQVRVRHFLDSHLSNAFSIPSTPLEKTAEQIWQWKGAVTTRQTAYRRLAGNSQLAPVFKRLQSVSQQLSVISEDRPIAPPTSAEIVEQEAHRQKQIIWKQHLADLTDQREHLERQIASVSKEFRRLREPLNAKRLQSQLTRATAFIDFFEYNHITTEANAHGKWKFERRLVALVVMKDRKIKLVTLGRTDAIGNLVSVFRLPLRAVPNTGPETAEAAKNLRLRLWAPIEEHLDGIDTVVISPDTVLGTLPFAALPGRKEGTYLIEDYRIAMLPTANQMMSLFEDEPPELDNCGLLVVGDVNYDRPADGTSKKNQKTPLLAEASTQREVDQLRAVNSPTFDSLPGFRTELDVVQRLFQSNFTDLPMTTLSGDTATESELLEQAAKARVLHVITHGYFAAPSVKSISQVDIKHDGFDSDVNGGPDPFINTYLPGLLSGLAMAGANNPSKDPEDPRDGILRASEIEASSLQGVDLVVLSACETGLGKVAGGEGLTGLQRAFQVAGARSVIASLWKVDDAATTELMRLFYTNLWEKKMSKIDALREAQLTMLNHHDAATGELRSGFTGKKQNIDQNKPPPKPTRTGERLDPRYWAAFQLSGDWR